MTSAPSTTLLEPQTLSLTVSPKRLGGDCRRPAQLNGVWRGHDRPVGWNDVGVCGRRYSSLGAKIMHPAVESLLVTRFLGHLSGSGTSPLGSVSIKTIGNLGYEDKHEDYCEETDCLWIDSQSRVGGAESGESGRAYAPVMTKDGTHSS